MRDGSPPKGRGFYGQVRLQATCRSLDNTGQHLDEHGFPSPSWAVFSAMRVAVPQI